MDIINFELPDQ